MLVSVLAAAIAPGLALLAYFYWKDRYETEPLAMVIKLFAAGMLIVLPAIILQRVMMLWLGDSPFIFSFVISAGTEELLKFTALYLLIFHHAEFDEPYDGIVYATAVSLGFATLENILYVTLQPVTFGTLLARALLPVSGHALFGVFMGYALGKAKFSKGRHAKLQLLLACLLPLLWHGLFDFMMLSVPSERMWIAVPFMLLLWFRGIISVNKANSVSPFRMLKREEEIKF